MIKPEELREFMPSYHEGLVLELFEECVIEAAEYNREDWSPTEIVRDVRYNQVLEWVDAALTHPDESNPVIRALQEFEENGYMVNYETLRISWEA